ncbi:beta-propeller domain-containing protein [Hyalangium rubrum]|uniref:Beta-propeller domain-containing protein n=1 Tax=Hyalangium rubrum TaxID=3103134 RepID=A0ABU5H990_9BACT|nr:beta-propeller domain-containing protein [Hyalangium sp. s54d21]MDY7230045.1 beta-propeller domain-containing protein [Hyalangium sp. s54d21]
MKWMRFGGLGLALVVAGCDSDKTGPEQQGLPGNMPLQTQARLQSFDTCEDLESYIEDTAVLDMRAQVSWQKRMMDYWDRGGGIPVDDGGMPEAGAPGMPGAPPNQDSGAGAPGGKPNDYTDTNNQVKGVDEADFVKNDGTRIFVISGNKLYLHRSWPAESLQAMSSLTLEGWPQQMFLAEQDRVVIFSAVTYQEQGSGGSKPGGGMDAPCSPVSCGGYGYYGSNATKVTVVNVADLASPQVVDELYLPGSYSNARRTAGTVRLVLNDNFRYPDGLRWWPDYEPDLWKDKARLQKAVDALMDQNEQVIRDRSLAQWLPKGWRKRPDGTRVEVGYDCRDFHRSNTPAKLGFVTVATLNLDTGAQESTVRRTSLVAEPGELYMSHDALYMASRHWWWWPEDGQRDYTYLHKFDIREPGVTRYAGSGWVDGYLLNQFSMDEHEGVLRVATTLSTWRRTEENPWGTAETTNRLTTFRERDGFLRKAGQSEELAKGERIFSARFIGNKGYVVTFRQVDPLFTFDLSNPENPRKVGELKVPGFSTYIHPLDDSHLITIGMHVPENPSDPSPRAVKLSMFDVSNLANPQETFTQVVGTAYGWSDALYEHKAFNYFPAKGLLAIPFSDYTPSPDYWSGFRSELKVFRVDTTTGFTPLGSISVADQYQVHSYRGWSWYWTPNVRRSVMADDYVYAISDAGVRVAHVDNLQVPLASTSFQPSFTP